MTIHYNLNNYVKNEKIDSAEHKLIFYTLKTETTRQGVMLNTFS